jgi:riboflavin kinase/FMN adenylyltransferase
MEIINGSDRLPPTNKPLYLALGNFDGVHRGHQEIINKTVERAAREGGVSAAYILNPHPAIALMQDRGMALLTDIVDRAEIMGELGLDYLIMETFNGDLPGYTPEEFIAKILRDKLSARGVFIGDNYRFGSKGAGNAETLHLWGERVGFTVDVIPIVYYEQERVSSSLIRSLISEGEVKKAADYLNYYFYRHGRVIRGSGIGKSRLFPTANLIASQGLLWPGQGVYMTAVGRLEDELLYGVTNVGAKPTLQQYDEKVVETHILDYSKDIYNREIRICFLEKIRETRKFSSLDELKMQIEQDINRAKLMLHNFKQETNGKGRSLQAGCSVLRS